MDIPTEIYIDLGIFIFRNDNKPSIAFGNKLLTVININTFILFRYFLLAIHESYGIEGSSNQLNNTLLLMMHTNELCSNLMNGKRKYYTKSTSMKWRKKNKKPTKLLFISCSCSVNDVALTIDKQEKYKDKLKMLNFCFFSSFYSIRLPFFPIFISIKRLFIRIKRKKKKKKNARRDKIFFVD